MPTYKLIVPVVAVALLGATVAVAKVVRDRDEHGDMPGDADRAAWHQSRCVDRYAHSVSRVTYLEARLGLSDSQRPAFDTWKSAVLASAKTDENDCATRDSGAGNPTTILDRDARQELMLKSRLSALEAELPSLRSLYETLTPEQKTVFDRRMHSHEGHGRHGGDNWARHGLDSRNGEPSGDHDD